MKNLFDYATKELSQDAFLCWLFNCYDDPEIGFLAKELLAEMINLESKTHVSPNDLNSIVAHTQVEEIDIIVDFKINDEFGILAIEDKVSSNEHSNQLVRYKKIIERWNRLKKEYNGRKSFYVYYKTNEIDKNELDRVMEAGWQNYSFEKISDFWKKHSSVNNIIVAQYAEHIKGIWSDSQNIERPKENNINQWISYYKKTIVPRLNELVKDKCDLDVSATRFGYVNLKAFPKGKLYKGYPFLEIRSRDCLSDEFQAKLLMYDVDKDESGLPKGLMDLRAIVKQKESKGIFKGNYGAKQNKQLCHSPRKDVHFIIRNDDDFVRLAKEAIDEYMAIISSWIEKYGE